MPPPKRYTVKNIPLTKTENINSAPKESLNPHDTLSVEEEEPTKNDKIGDHGEAKDGTNNDKRKMNQMKMKMESLNSL